MANPKSKAPTRKQIKDSQTAAERIKQFGPKIKKFFPQFDKLNMRQKDDLALRKAIQDIMSDHESYTDEGIRKEGLSMLGVASGEYDDYATVNKDSAGREQSRAKQKRQNPAGFNKGGMIHRGRKAGQSSETSR